MSLHLNFPVCSLTVVITPSSKIATNIKYNSCKYLAMTSMQTILTVIIGINDTRSSLVASWMTVLSWRRGLHNSMKLWVMMCRATQDGLVIMKSSDKMWSTGGGNGKPRQYYCCENHMNIMKRQNDMIPKHEPADWKVSSMLLGKNRRQLLIALERMKWLGQSGKLTLSCGYVWW